MSFRNSAISILVLIVLSVSVFAQAPSHRRNANYLAAVGGACMEEGACFRPSMSDAESLNPENVYHTICYACHASGGANAPMTGDKDAWNERLAKGRDVLYRNAIAGLNLMPPKGLCFQCSDKEIMAAVDYFLNSAGL